MIRSKVHLNRGSFTFDVDFQADSSVTGVFGPSGAGKTTLINLIAGLERPDEGTISLDEALLFDSARNINVPAHRRRVGVVFQEHRLFPHYSVKGNLLYGWRRGSELPARIIDLLELGGLLQRRVHDLSGGERQRVALGRALLSNPHLLLFDEPLASLDQRLRQQIIPYLRRVRDDLAVPMLYVSHDLTEILQLTDRLLVLDGGRSVGYGRYADVVHDDAVLPVVHDRGMKNVLTARVIAHEIEDGVSVLGLGLSQQPQQLAQRSLIAPLCRAPAGANVMISIQPWDVALASERASGVSIQNQIRGIITRCTTHERSVLVDVDIGLPLIVEISRRSAASMGITTGQSIVCLIKSHAIQHVGTL